MSTLIHRSPFSHTAIRILGIAEISVPFSRWDQHLTTIESELKAAAHHVVKSNGRVTWSSLAHIQHDRISFGDGAIAYEPEPGHVISYRYMVLTGKIPSSLHYTEADYAHDDQTDFRQVFPKRSVSIKVRGPERGLVSRAFFPKSPVESKAKWRA